MTDSGMRAFRLAYDGRPFHGFQRQPTVPTVEDVLFGALRAQDVTWGDPVSGDGGPDTSATPADRPPGYAAAGRTDAGVSALAQTVAFEAPAWLTPRALNGELPGTVRAWAHADVPADFHATHDASERAYVYHLYAPDLDDGRARAALDACCGEHDFHNLTPDADNTVRTLSGDLARDGAFVLVRVSAGGFCRELVRRVVTLVQAVGAGQSDLAHVERLLRPARVDGAEGVGPAPPAPLVLTDVAYPGVSFTPDAQAVESARGAFDEHRLEAVVRARTVGTLVDGVTTASRGDVDAE